MHHSVVPTRADAEALDASDPLREFRGEFVVADESTCYLDGNSLGRLPRASLRAVADVMEHEWGRELIAGWDGWIDEAQHVGDLIGRAALGAAAGQVLAIDTTSANFFQLCAAALRARPGRGTVVSDAANFPTDRYILEGICRDRGLRLVLVDDVDGEGDVSLDRLASVLNDDVALVTLSVVQYRSGALHDVAGTTAAIQRHGALALWDASHAVGVVPLEFDRWGVDLAVGCTYKYGNSGPGAPAWLYVAAHHLDALQVPIQGWFAQADQFGMGPSFERAPGIRGFQVASPPIVGLRCVREGFRMIERAGIGAIAAKAARATAMMVSLHDAWLAPLGCALVTPRDPARRGGHLTFHHPQAEQLSRAMRAANVIGDYRAPNQVRVACSPLATSYVEVWDGFARIRDLLSSGGHLRAAPPSSRVT